MNDVVNILKFPKELTIHQIETIHRSFIDNLPTAKKVILDFSDLQTLDLTGIQFIHSLQNYLEKKALPYSTQHTSENLSSQFTRYGFSISPINASTEEKK